MRLTLRTMLAYLDDVLSPQDAAVLGDKIKQSDYATKLSRHIRASVRENSVGAPALSGKGHTFTRGLSRKRSTHTWIGLP